jgi:hypothetical protein
VRAGDADAVRRDLGQQIATALVGRADVAQQHRQQVFLHLVRTQNLDRGKDDAFLVELACQAEAAGRDAADIGVMCAVGDEECGLLTAICIDWGDDGDVGQMGAARIRVVQQHHVARREGMGIQGSAHARRHRAEVDRQMLRLDDGVAASIEDGARVIAPLLDVGAVAGPHQDFAHLFGHRLE